MKLNRHLTVFTLLLMTHVNENMVIYMRQNLSNVEKKALRKKAVALKPVVMIGQHGLTKAVLAEVDNALDAHELIKILIRGASKNDRIEQSLKIEKDLDAEAIHQIGGVIVFFRRAPVVS